jgi:hypothetical protein
MEFLTEIDYRIQGYKKNKIENNLGDIITVEYYNDYDFSTQVWSDLRVKETRLFERDAVNGVPFKLTVFIEWFTSNKINPIATKQLIKPLSVSDGLKANYNSRTRLIESAKVTALAMMGLASGQNFLAEVSLEINTYKEGNIQPLIDAITNTTNPDVTQAVKDALINILNVSYIPA